MKKLFFVFVLALGVATTATSQIVVERVHYVKGKKTVTIDTLKRDGKLIKGSMESYDYCEVGDEMPDMKIVREDGKTFNIKDFRGKTIVVNFWITTCGPCRREMTRVKHLIDVFGKDNFAFLAIGNGEDVEAAKRFHETTGVDFLVYCDPESQADSKLFKNKAHPINYVVNPQGKIVMIENGYNEEKFAALKSKIKETINKK